ncbi:MAG TPA: thioesterase family protein, partial [Solirubrobacteraceae bacterium]|nr:thioesterase family protein [Solirubrobacteraceae bacterium]
MDTVFDRDTAVRRIEHAPETSAQAASEVLFAADIASGWRAGRGPHGGYLAAMFLRAFTGAVDDPGRTPRSLTIHYTRAPEPGPIEIRVTVERAGRSLSTLSARMEQADRVTALALAAFSVPREAPGANELPIPDLPPADAERVSTA